MLKFEFYWEAAVLWSTADSSDVTARCAVQAWANCSILVHLKSHHPVNTWSSAPQISFLCTPLVFSFRPENLSSSYHRTKNKSMYVIQNGKFPVRFPPPVSNMVTTGQYSLFLSQNTFCEYCQWFYGKVAFFMVFFFRLFSTTDAENNVCFLCHRPFGRLFDKLKDDIYGFFFTHTRNMSM